MWESRWLPDFKENKAERLSYINIIIERCLYIELVLPVIQVQKVFEFEWLIKQSQSGRTLKTE